jgi:hypothetical protein
MCAETFDAGSEAAIKHRHSTPHAAHKNMPLDLPFDAISYHNLVRLAQM